ncbi:hypothetical protein [Adonisia turfae]
MMEMIGWGKLVWDSILAVPPQVDFYKTCQAGFIKIKADKYTV